MNNQQEEAKALEEALNVLNELIRSMHRLKNTTGDKFRTCDVKRLEQAIYIQNKYVKADNSPSIVQSQQPFSSTEKDEETLTAKLRNQLSPIYGLAEMIINSENDSDLMALTIEQARQAISLKSVIDNLLLAIEHEQQPSPAMTLEECKEQVAKKYGHYNFTAFYLRCLSDANPFHDMIPFLDEVAELYANQLRK